MSLKPLFISENNLKDNAFINENVSLIKLRPTIVMCQEMYIQQIIGSDLFKEISDQIINDDLTQTNEDLLKDYIQPALTWWVMAEAPMILAFRYDNMNVQRGISENAQIASMSELKDQMDFFRNKAEWYSERLTRFLITNESDFPAYASPSGDYDTILPNRSNYRTGLALKGKCRTEWPGKYIGRLSRDCDC
jgi:hypothetical protein